MKYQKSLAQNMIDILAGNFESAKKPTKPSNSSLATEDSLFQNNNKVRAHEQPLERKPRMPYGK